MRAGSSPTWIQCISILCNIVIRLFHLIFHKSALEKPRFGCVPAYNLLLLSDWILAQLNRFGLFGVLVCGQCLVIPFLIDGWGNQNLHHGIYIQIVIRRKKSSRVRSKWARNREIKARDPLFLLKFHERHGNPYRFLLLLSLSVSLSLMNWYCII